MAKVPARLRSVTYSLSPMRTGVMHGLFKDWASGMATRVKENAVDAGVFCALPLGATVWCVEATRTTTRNGDATMTRDDDAIATRIRATGVAIARRGGATGGNSDGIRARRSNARERGERERGGR